MSRPLTVWFPTIRANSGADVFTERLAEALCRRGVKAVISWLPHRSELAPTLIGRAVPPEGTDIIHANSGNAFAFKRKGMPLVVTEHHYVLDPAYRPYKSYAQHAFHRWLLNPYFRRSYASADVITTVSRFTAAVMAKHAGVPSAKVIPNWLDCDTFSPMHDAGAMEAGRPFRLLFVGNTSRRKGADVIPVLAGLLGNGFEIRCTAGLRQQSRESQPVNVRVLGRLSGSDLLREYRGCDAVLVPSRYEGFGYAALEAMACAKPVVAFRCGAIDEVVEEGVTALLCDIDDVQAMAAHCRTLAVSPELAAVLGAAGRRRATTEYAESRALDEYIAVYRSFGNGS